MKFFWILFLAYHVAGSPLGESPDERLAIAREAASQLELLPTSAPEVPMEFMEETEDPSWEEAEIIDQRVRRAPKPRFLYTSNQILVLQCNAKGKANCDAICRAECRRSPRARCNGTCRYSCYADRAARCIPGGNVPI
nr:c166.2 [Tranosema rostrale ichnovirus]